MTASKVDQVVDFDPQAIGNAAKELDANAHLACLDLPYMGLIASHHESELPLR